MLDTTTTVRDIVAGDFRAAAVFQKHGIDFCCGGNRPVADACREQGVEASVVVAELEAATAAPGDVPRYDSWELDALAQHIVKTHHAYVRRTVEILGAHTQKVASVHGDRHPEVKAIAGHFLAVAQDLMQHMFKEERMLFPYIERLAEAARAGGAAPVAPFGTIANPIRMMEAEHEVAGDLMAAIRAQSGNYTLPEDACTTFRVTYQELQEFEADLHQHVHLENNLLFPKALELERQLAGQ